MIIRFGKEGDKVFFFCTTVDFARKVVETQGHGRIYKHKTKATHLVVPEGREIPDEARPEVWDSVDD
jgi:hypothetical protein